MLLASSDEPDRREWIAKVGAHACTLLVPALLKATLEGKWSVSKPQVARSERKLRHATAPDRTRTQHMHTEHARRARTDTAGASLTGQVSDFGLSRVIAKDCNVINTRTFGTVTHMPPELLSKGGWVSGRQLQASTSVSALPFV